MDTVNPPATGQLASQNRMAGAPRPSSRTPARPSHLNPSQQAVVNDAPTSCRATLERAYRGKSKAAGIKAFCLRCVGYARNDVRDCTSKGCPLWPYRPYQQYDEADDTE